MAFRPLTRRSALVVLASSTSIISCRSEREPAQTNTGQTAAEFHPGDRLTSFAQEILSSTNMIQVKAGGTYDLGVSVKNTGSQPWFGGKGEVMTVDAGYRWVDASGKVLAIEGGRAYLSKGVLKPGESDELKLSVVAPTQSGSYTLWISMVQEGVDWFYAKDSKPLVLTAKVV